MKVPFSKPRYEDFAGVPYFYNDPHPNEAGHEGFARAAEPLVEELRATLSAAR